jgi:hypothetical protein
MGKSLLTLDTLEPDRDFIEIDKKSYSLRAQDELSLTEIARIRRMSQKVIDKGLNADSTEEDMAEIEGFANQVLSLIVVELPDDIRDKLKTPQKFQIVQAFTAAASSRRAGTKAGETGSQPITAGSSPGSSDSTSTDQSLPG